MRLITGPAGSGKTAVLLDGLREALRTGRRGIRLLTPTATLAQHLQNQIAREGYVFSTGCIQTLSGFLRDIPGLPDPVPDSVLYLIVEQAARRVDRPEFARVIDTAGFCAKLARSIEDFSSAGCDSAKLAAHLPDAPLAKAFLDVYRETDRILAARGMALRGRRLERAAALIERDGLEGIHELWMAGFHALPDPELRFLSAIARRCAVTLTLSDADFTGFLRGRLEEFGCRVERLGRPRHNPAVEMVTAQTIEREVEEIARRILRQVESGLPFREIGVIVRSPDNYLPLLESTLERFGIPARSYFERRLNEHAAIRFLTDAVDAMLGGWDHAETLAVLRLSPRFAEMSAMDRFDFKVREQIPNTGLGPLKALVEYSDPLLHKIDSLGMLEEWRSLALSPKDWAARMRTLRNLFRPARPQTNGDRAAWLLRNGQGEALDALDSALDEAALALGPIGDIELEPYWRAVKAVLRLAPLRLRDGRRNVIHLLSASEARQWTLKVVFVCGMTERQFPQVPPHDLFFPEAARQSLNVDGIRVRTSADWEREERSLYDSALTRATMSVVLTYPELDGRGQLALRSQFLEGRLEAVQPARAVLPMPRDPHGPWSGTREGIGAADLLPVLREKTGKLSPTGLESYLQCPFQHYLGKVLRLKSRPLLPEERLDPLTRGNIVHSVLAKWWVERGDIGACFEEVFARELELKQIPQGYHTERQRNEMLDDLRAFVEDDSWPRGSGNSKVEQGFTFVLAEGVEITGKIDRLDELDDHRAWVIDYKYSAAAKAKERKEDENLLQAPLYLRAAERYFGLVPAGMSYVAMRGKVGVAGWNLDEERPEWLPEAEAKTLRIVSEIRSGRAEVNPANRKRCDWCDFKDACRVPMVAAEEVEEVESAS